MTTQPAPLLTSDDANYALITKDVDDVRAELQALADGRTVCAPVQTEEECRAEFEAWASKNFDACERGEAECAWAGYIACARAAGLVAEKKEGG